MDLHTFNPKEVPELISDYFRTCIDAGIFSIRVIHGKGRGILKNRVLSLLKLNPMVKSFQGAPPGAGGWGATIVNLKSHNNMEQ
ncbi:MAG TPA: DNA mismatch repair protein MutS [Desulfobacteraceae bacterium]|nr:DNA mismatch repair protein MutS [Desulfobacteraceae bacterium]